MIRLPCNCVPIEMVAGNGKIFFLFPSALARAVSRGVHLPLSARAAPGLRRSRPGRVCHARAARQAKQPAAAALVGSARVLPRLRSAAARLPSAAGKPRPAPTRAAYREVTKGARRGRVSRACKPVVPCAGRALRLWARSCPPRLPARAAAEGNGPGCRSRRLCDRPGV